MRVRTANTRGRRKLWRAGAALSTGVALLAVSTWGAASTSPLLESAKVAGFRGALVTSSHRTLYLLSDEKGAKIHCSASCFRYWPPVLVKDSVRHVSLGPNVKGRVGFLPRGKSMKQVTFNSYPLYRYAGDSLALSAHGEGIVSYGGTWYLVSADSTSPARTALTKKSSGSTSAATGSTSSTTAPAGGGGW